MRARLFMFTVAFALCVVEAPSASAQPIDQIPMYGGMNRAEMPDLRAADEKFISDTVQKYGNKVRASAAFVENGFAYYGRDDLANAMRRFNQAWLLDASNPEVYFGFAVVLHDRRQNCDAAKQFEKAASFGKYVKGMAPDAGRVLVLCAVQDKSLSAEAKQSLFTRSDALYAEALASEPNKGYVYASMASAMYWRDNFEQAWVYVKLARTNGGRLPEPFLRLLREKLQEPA